MENEMTSSGPEAAERGTPAACQEGQPIGDLPDGVLLDRFRTSKDPEAFALLVARHGPLVLNVCRRVLQNQHDAEDAFQATFLVLVRKASTIGKREALASWLYKVAYRIAVHARVSAMRRYRQEMLAARVPVMETDEYREWLDVEPVLDEELQRLPEKYRVPFVLRFLQGKTYEEIAQQLDWPKGTVSTRLTRAREQLRRRLVRRGVVLGAGSLVFELARQSGVAAVPPSLLASTTQAALQFAAGPVAAGALSVQAAALTKAALHALWITQLKLVAVGVLTATLLGTGVGAVVYHRAGSQRDTVSAEAAGSPAVPTVVAAETDVDRLQGTWAITSWSSGDGPAALMPEDKLVVSRQHVTVVLNGVTEVWTITMDDSRTPKEVTATLGDGETRLGIYRVEGNSITVCLSRPPEPRPSEFATRAGAAYPQLFTAQR